VIRLQYGDLEGAERFRKRAELLAIQASARPMFVSNLAVELAAHAMIRDVAGVKQIAERIAPMAAAHSGWQAYAHLARGHFERLVGNLERACEAYEACLAIASPTAEQSAGSSINLAWAPASAAYVETLLDAGRAEDALAEGERALHCAQRFELDVAAHCIVRALALAEGKLVGYDAAVDRLGALIDEQVGLGVTGVELGATYEARARVAIWGGDQAAVEDFGQLAAEQYRHGTGSALSSRYELLLDEARRAGVETLAPFSDVQVTGHFQTGMTRRETIEQRVAQALAGAWSCVFLYYRSPRH
jgi:tetratricopeptide (TPR) repeat protein